MSTDLHRATALTYAVTAAERAHGALTVTYPAAVTAVTREQAIAAVVGMVCDWWSIEMAGFAHNNVVRVARGGEHQPLTEAELTKWVDELRAHIDEHARPIVATLLPADVLR